MISHLLWHLKKNILSLIVFKLTIEFSLSRYHSDFVKIFFFANKSSNICIIIIIMINIFDVSFFFHVSKKIHKQELILLRWYCSDGKLSYIDYYCCCVCPIWLQWLFFIVFMQSTIVVQTHKWYLNFKFKCQYLHQSLRFVTNKCSNIIKYIHSECIDNTFYADFFSSLNCKHSSLVPLSISFFKPSNARRRLQIRSRAHLVFFEFVSSSYWHMKVVGDECHVNVSKFVMEMQISSRQNPSRK